MSKFKIGDIVKTNKLDNPIIFTIIGIILYDKYIIYHVQNKTTTIELNYFLEENRLILVKKKEEESVVTDKLRVKVKNKDGSEKEGEVLQITNENGKEMYKIRFLTKKENKYYNKWYDKKDLEFVNLWGFINKNE